MVVCCSVPVYNTIKNKRYKGCTAVGLFRNFRKKDDVQKDIARVEQGEKPKMCPRCGRKYPMEEERCEHCGIPIYVEGENYCTNTDCERCQTKHSFAEDEFFCDKCNSPTIISVLDPYEGN